MRGFISFEIITLDGGKELHALGRPSWKQGNKHAFFRLLKIMDVFEESTGDQQLLECDSCLLSIQ